MTRYHSKLRRSLRSLSITVGLAGGLIGLLLIPKAARADDADIIKPEPLVWARVDFLRNRVQLLPHDAAARDARIADLLSVGDTLRTLRRSRAELRFNDDSLARIGERATFRFTPNTRNFQLTNGTVLLLIPPERGRTTIQTPNAVTGIQGSALFVRYIPETNTTIVGALTDNPGGPMVLFNRDGSEQQALEANQIGVIEGDRITQLYRFDSQLFWESSGLAEGINYSQDASPNASDPLDGVREEIREAVSNQDPLPSEGEGVIENPASFSRPDSTESGSTDTPEVSASTPASTEPSTGSSSNSTTATNGANSSTSQNQPTTVKPTNNGVPSGETATNGTSSTSGVGQTDGANNNPQAAISPSSPLTAEPGGVQDTNLGGAGSAADSVVELKFKGTPAEAYLAIPLPRTARVPEGANSNSLEPTSSEASSGAGSLGANGSTNATPAGSSLTPARSVPASSTPGSAIAGSTPAGSIPANSIPAGLATGSKPAVTMPPAQSTAVPSLTLPIDHDGPSGAIIGKPPSPAGSGAAGAAITAPPGTPPTGTPPTGTPPTDSGTPSDAPPPTLPEGTQTPSSAEPIVPILNPSTSLVPVGPTVPPAATGGLPPAINPPLLLNGSSGDSTSAGPTGTSSGTAVTPTTAVPTTDVLVIPSAINNPVTDVPFKPEIGGITLEHVLDPINLPANLPGNVPPSTGDATSQGGGLSSGDAPATGGQTPGQGSANPPATGNGRVLL